jgi:LPXTG-motif cell wall-anchored protein
VPIASAALLVGGVLVILIGYLPPVSERLAFLPWLGSNWALVLGFVLLSIGFLFLTRWR